MQMDTSVKWYLDEIVAQVGYFPIVSVVDLAKWVIATYRCNKDVFVFGNGGGASIADHFASDLNLHPFQSENKGEPSNAYRFRVHCLNESSGTLTRLGNDMGYDQIFVEQLRNYDLRDCLVIALSVSGNSPNIVKALEYAKSNGARTACIGKGGKAKDIVDIGVFFRGASIFPGQTGANDNYFHVEDFQQSIAHMVTGLLKEAVNG